MVKPLPMITLGAGALILFSALLGLNLLTGANLAAPGCTGPAVQRCDYVATAKVAVERSGFRPFDPDLGYEVFDRGSSVLIQQYTPPGEPELNHAPSVLIDKKSCRACAVDWYHPTPKWPDDPRQGPLLMRIPAEGQVAAAKRAERWKDGPGGISLL